MATVAPNLSVRETSVFTRFNRAMDDVERGVSFLAGYMCLAGCVLALGHLIL